MPGGDAPHDPIDAERGFKEVDLGENSGPGPRLGAWRGVSKPSEDYGTRVRTKGSESELWLRQRMGTRAQIEESIAEARRVLTEHDEYLRGNETATRTLVIDGVLTALGWDIKDPARVWLEHRANGNKDGLRSAVVVSPIPCHRGGEGCGLGAERHSIEGMRLDTPTEIGARYRGADKWRSMGSVGDWCTRETQKGEHRSFTVNLTTGEIAEIAATLGESCTGMYSNNGRG